MDADRGLKEFAENLGQDVIVTAQVEGAEALRGDVFAARIIEQLTELGELDDGHVCYHRARGIEVGGYSFDAEEGSLDLFVNVFKQEVPPATVSKQEVETAFRRLTAFLHRSVEGYHHDLEEASPVFDMAFVIHELRKSLERVRLFLFTDGIATVDVVPDQEFDGIPVSHHIWDIRRLYRAATSGRGPEPIEIDFIAEFGQSIPCLKVPETAPEYDAYLAVFPAEVLNAIYAKYGPRLLELNVRSFLQARGKVNKGIKKTILEEPDRFLAYNNGISATASSVDVVKTDEGFGIGAVSDLQIVNGGQTTASLYSATRSDGADLSSISVQAKLTIVDGSRLSTMVPLISRYANSQNKVNEADFSANDPFHVRLEELSRTVWAPPSDGTQRQTRWFYERARGQYQDALAREGTAGRKRQFKVVHPPSQRFTKTDLAKFENTWDQLPHIVSRGAEKNFREFTIRLSQRGKFEPDQAYFERLVAKAILFRRTQKIVSGHRFGGYRANIVTYAIALAVHRTSSRIDLARIWRDQGITEALGQVLSNLSIQVHRVVTSPPGGRNVTEWAKTPSCWEAIRASDADISELEDELVSVSGGRTRSQGIEAPTAEEEELIARVASTASDVWFRLSKWAKETGNLEPWQRSLAYSLGRLANQDKSPTRKQAAQGIKILREADRLGFRADVPQVR